MRPAILLIALLLGAAAVVAADPARKLAQTVAPSIVHGKDSARVGWYVSIGWLVDGDWGSICGGMLISQTHVLTATHCVFNPNANVAFKPADIKAAIGMRRLTDKPDVDFDLATVTNIIVHPRYLPGPGSRYVGRGYDIAILELDPKTVSGKNELVALPTYVPKPRNPVPAGTRLQLIGLGDLGNDTAAPVLQRTELVLERLETCNEAYANWPDVDNFFEAPMICAGAPRTNKFTDACPGDSGGPLYAPRTAGRPYDTVIGLVSFGDDCDVLYNRTRFGPPGAYTNVAQLRPWVDANLACLAQGQACPWGGTCLDDPANGCATCQPGIDGDPTACATCTVSGYVVDKDDHSRQYGQCRRKDCRDVVERCTTCASRRPLQCAACKWGYKVANNQCIPKTCLDYDRGCQQCDLVNPLMCTACKRNHVLDRATGQCVRVHQG
ncbi:hypothetical protein COHA_005596 [Chlorella ohadii]|uniref:Peptidase S1 domain-containing protein n=1 Tax=Chlorella ohadii TaxID=2649997 RepID=A0AAD5DUJ7_9CHLO|nr:hypothetical protein COHA_005596 [Chlorella ohadii]